MLIAMEIVYHILNDDGSIWDSQIFSEKVDDNILKKEYRLYKRHIFSSGSDGIYIHYLNRIYLVDRYELFQKRKDLPMIVNDFFSETLGNEEWVANTTLRIKEEILWAATQNKGEDPSREKKIETWFLGWIMRRFPNVKDFQDMFSLVKSNLKSKPGGVYGILDLYLTNLCRKVGWELDHSSYSCVERDGKWHRIINYFIKFAPVIPVCTYKVLCSDRNEDEDELTLVGNFEKAVSNSKERFCKEWWKRKRDVKLKNRFNKSSILEITEKLNVLETAISTRDTQRLEEIISSISGCLETVEALPSDKVLKIYDMYKENSDHVGDFKEFFELLLTKLTEDDIELYKAGKYKRDTKVLILTAGSDIYLPKFTDQDIEKICWNYEYRSEMIRTSLLIKAMSIPDTYTMMSLGRCAMYITWYIKTILQELWYLSSVVREIEIKPQENIVSELSQSIPSWNETEEKWIDTNILERALGFPTESNLLEKVLGFTWKYCLSWNIDILLGSDSLLEWISSEDEDEKLGLFIDIQIVAMSYDNEFTLSLHYIPIVRGKRERPYRCFVYLDSYSSVKMADTLRFNHLKKIFEAAFSTNYTSKVLYRMMLPEAISNTILSLVQSLSVNLLTLFYFSRHMKTFSSFVNSEIEKIITTYFNKYDDPAIKRQEKYYKNGKMSSQLNALLQNQFFTIPVTTDINKEFIKWLEKFEWP
jgi:hypothetical protein